MDPSHIVVTKEMIERVRKFSVDVLKETYNRFQKDYQTRFERIFVGKLGELVFSVYLDSLGIQHDIQDMFAIFPGTGNVDKFDFVIPGTKQVIDIKTAYRSFHQRILIPCGTNGQWTQMPKDFYVGVKVENIAEGRGPLLINENNSIFASISGYMPRNDKKWMGPTDLGEGPCMWVFLRDLYPIGTLVKMISR